MSGQDDRRPDAPEDAEEELASDPRDEDVPAGAGTVPKTPSASADDPDSVDDTDDTDEPTGIGGPASDEESAPEDPASGAGDDRPDEPEASEADGASGAEAESKAAGSDVAADAGEPDDADPRDVELPEEQSALVPTEAVDRERPDDAEDGEDAASGPDTVVGGNADDREIEREGADEHRENDVGDPQHVPGEAVSAETSSESAETSSESAETSSESAADPRPAGAWRRLGAEMRPRFSRSQVLAGVLCAALGFALVVQVQQSSSDQLSSARQDDLVRLLEEVTDRAERLSSEVAELEGTRDELESGTNKAASALDLAQDRAAAEGILSGRLPAQGPGVVVQISDPGGAVEAPQLFNVLEELRNAGAEVVAVNDVRLVTSTWFRDSDGSIVVDGQEIGAPYEWTVIGDPATLDRALEIPGGALATVRTAGAEATTTRHDSVRIDEVREPSEPEYAKPQDADG